MSCAGSGTSTTSTTASSTEAALSTANDTTDSPELADVLTHLAAGPRDEGVEAWRCDPNPTITTTTVCGQSFPTALHFAWTSCAGAMGPRAPAQPMLGDGGAPPLPCGDGGAPEGDAPPPPPVDGGAPGARGNDTSSGTVDIVIAVDTDPSGTCGTTPIYTFTEQVTFSIDRQGPNGSAHDEGSTQSSSERALDATAFTKTVTLDVKHTEPGVDGGSASTTELSGALTVVFDSSASPPTRTISGTLKITEPDGSDDSATLTNVVRDPPRTCRAPVSGTLAYTDGETGASHDLVFGPTCGAATLDGTTISLEQPPAPN